MIVEGLEGLAFPVDKLTALPDNPRRGDVQAVARSYATFGQRKPIVARHEGDGGIVIAGNHQLAAAKELAWEKIAVVWVDDDDLTAKAFALADNRTGDLGSYDNADLLAMLQSVHDGDSALFEATAFDEETLGKLLGKLEEPDAETVDIPESFAIIIDCESEEAQVGLLERLTEEGLKCRALIS